jgi:hypothetical protein
LSLPYLYKGDTLAYSNVGIVNLSLARIGEGAISSIDGTDSTSILAKQVYDYVLDEVLEEHDWTFAKKSYALAQDATAPVDPAYNFRYALPSDYIKDRGINHERMDYVIRGGYLLTNYDNTSGDLILHYTRRETNPALYSPQFINALAWRLAEEMSFRLVRGSSNVQDRCGARFARALLQAKGANQMQNYLEDEKGSTAWAGAGRGIINSVDLTEDI